MKDRALTASKWVIFGILLFSAMMYWLGSDKTCLLPIPRSGVTAIQTPAMGNECTDIIDIEANKKCTKLLSLPGGMAAWADCNSKFYLRTQYVEFHECVGDKINNIVQ